MPVWSNDKKGNSRSPIVRLRSARSMHIRYDRLTTRESQEFFDYNGCADSARKSLSPARVLPR